MTFNSNVQPKKIVKPTPDNWMCHKCNVELPYWTRRCPTCEGYRND